MEPMTENTNSDQSARPDNVSEALTGSITKGSHVMPKVSLPASFAPPSAALKPAEQAPTQGSGSSDK